MQPKDPFHQREHGKRPSVVNLFFGFLPFRADCGSPQLELEALYKRF